MKGVFFFLQRTVREQKHGKPKKMIEKTKRARFVGNGVNLLKKQKKKCNQVLSPTVGTECDGISAQFPGRGDAAVRLLS